MVDKNYILELAKMYGIDVSEGESVHMVKDENGSRKMLSNDINEFFSFPTSNINSMVEEISLNTTFNLIYDDKILEVA